MFQGIFAAHSGWRWLVLLSVVVTIGFGLWGWLSSQKWRPVGRRVMLATTIIIDIQVLLGLTIYVMNQYWNHPGGTNIRYLHPLVMLVALFGIHTVSLEVRKDGPASQRYRLMAVGTLGVLALMIYGIMTLGGVERIFRMTPIF